MTILRPSLTGFVLSLTLFVCAGCAGNSPVRGLATTTGFATDTPEGADFVKQTRPAQLEYRPVGVKPPERAMKPMTEEELKGLEGSLEARRNSNEAQAAAAKALSNTPMAQPPVVEPIQ